MWCEGRGCVACAWRVSIAPLRGAAREAACAMRGVWCLVAGVVQAMPSLARGGCAGVGCVKAVPYKGNKKVWKNQINAGFFVPEWKILHITILHVTFAQFHLAEKRGRK